MRNQVPETDVMPGPWRQTLLRRLRAIVGEDSVLAHAEQLAPYECDGLSAHRQSPLVVVLHDTIEQLQSILRLCHELQVPVVARGAGTGLSGGALPLANGVLLGLAKFNRILDIDAHNRSARVQPGVRNLAIPEAAAPHGLYYAPDPSSQIACSIGGNVAAGAIFTLPALYILNLQPHPAQTVFICLSGPLMLGCCALFVIGGWSQTVINLDNTYPVLGISYAWLYAAAVVFGIGMAISIAYNVFDTVTRPHTPAELVLIRDMEDRIGADFSGVRLE